MPKRNVLQKYQRLMTIADKYAQEIQRFAQVQIEVTARLALEFKLDQDWRYRAYLYHDFLRMSPYNDGDVQMWSTGRRGGNDEEEGYFSVSQHLLSGNIAEFERELRAELTAVAQANEADRRKSLQDAARRLEAELNKVKEQL